MLQIYGKFWSVLLKYFIKLGVFHWYISSSKNLWFLKRSISNGNILAVPLDKKVNNISVDSCSSEIGANFSSKQNPWCIYLICYISSSKKMISLRYYYLVCYCFNLTSRQEETDKNWPKSRQQLYGGVNFQFNERHSHFRIPPNIQCRIPE